MDVQTEENAAAPSSAVEIYTDSYSANLDALFAKKGIAHGVRRLIEAGIAAIHDDDAVALAAALDEMPVNVNFCPVSAFPGGDSLLCYAARFNAPRCVELLLSHGASPDLILEGGDTALLTAVMQSPRAWEQWGFLHTEGGESKAGAAAAARGRMARAVEVLKQLLGAGADINRADADGYSPLYLAGHFGMPEFATILLTAGADVEQRANNGFTPLGQAVFDGHAPCVELLLGARAAVDRLDAADGSGRAPLWHAASSGHADCLRLLLASGADVGLAPTCGNAKDEFLAGTTAFFIACQRGHIECAEALLQAGAAVDETLRECDGFSALLMAAANGHPDCVRVCIGAGANVNIVAKSGRPIERRVLSRPPHVCQASNRGWRCAQPSRRRSPGPHAAALGMPAGPPRVRARALRLRRRRQRSHRERHHASVQGVPARPPRVRPDRLFLRCFSPDAGRHARAGGDPKRPLRRGRLAGRQPLPNVSPPIREWRAGRLLAATAAPRGVPETCRAAAA